MAKPGLFAREAAVRLLHAVLLEHRLLIDIVNGEDSLLIDLEPSERARAQSLAMTTLRNLGPIDIVLKKYLTKKPPFALLNILRVSSVNSITVPVQHKSVDKMGPRINNFALVTVATFADQTPPLRSRHFDPNLI